MAHVHAARERTRKDEGAKTIQLKASVFMHRTASEWHYTLQMLLMIFFIDL